MAYGAKTVTTSATLIIAANTNRIAFVIINTDTTNPVYLGMDSSVTTSTGLLLNSGATFQEDSGAKDLYKGDIYGISGGSIDLRYWEITR